MRVRAHDVESFLRKRNVFAAIAHETGLQPIEAALLISLEAHPHQTTSELAANLALRSQAVSQAITQLLAMDLVMEHQSPMNGRVRFRELTQFGLQQALDLLDAYNRRELDGSE